MTGIAPNSEVRAVLEAHRLNPALFARLRADSYEQQLARHSASDLDSFYTLLFIPGVPLAAKAGQCPVWPPGSKYDGAHPTLRILSEAASRWNAERALDVVDEVGQLVENFRAKLGGNPAAKLETMTDSLLAMLSQELLAAKLEGTSLSAQTKAIGQLLYKQKLKLDEDELKLSRDKFQFDAAQAALAKAAQLKTISSSKLSDTEKIKAARRALFGELPEENRA